MTYEEQGDVILESQGSVVFVDSDASDATVLFETAVGPQAVLTSDDAKNGGVNSIHE